MHPSISWLVRETQYPRLESEPSVSLYPDVVGMRRRLFWMHHSKLKDDKSDGDMNSRTNTFEVNMIIALVKHITPPGVYGSADVAVVPPYLGQLLKPRNKFGSTHAVLINNRDIYELNEDFSGSEDDSLSFPDQGSSKTMKGFLSQAVRFATVDNFKGEEAKFVIVSLVRSNPNNNLGVLRTPNRINIFLSRAQHGMYIFCNMDTTRNVSIWQKVEEILRLDGNTGDTLELCFPRHQGIALLVTTPSDFARLSPKAGCNLLCEKQLRFGHACIARRNSEILHEAMFCMSHVQNSRTAANILAQSHVDRDAILDERSYPSYQTRAWLRPRKKDIAVLRTSRPVF
jgi:hypothetical protein